MKPKINKTLNHTRTFFNGISKPNEKRNFKFLLVRKKYHGVMTLDDSKETSPTLCMRVEDHVLILKEKIENYDRGYNSLLIHSFFVSKKI